MNSTPSQLFKNVAFVVYPVAHVKASRSFYEGVLGLTVTANWDDQWVEYDIGNGTLAITTADEKRQAGARGAMVALEVVDFDAVLAALKEKNVSLADGPYDSPACRGGVIRDPDGNEIVLHARK
jgi:catechol 2,3-dioxygenase-like lactoylglutathione lyase family enzyme